MTAGGVTEWLRMAGVTGMMTGLLEDDRGWKAVKAAGSISGCCYCCDGLTDDTRSDGA